MSSNRSLFNELHPLFHVLDEQYRTQIDPFFVVPRERRGHRAREQSAMLDAIIDGPLPRTPQVFVTDEVDRFIVETELPGVPKENLDVSFADGGRSLTIKGSTISSFPAQEEQKEEAKIPPPKDQKVEAPVPTEVSEIDPDKHVARRKNESWFVRTVWLPCSVDPDKVVAKLEHGVLRLEIPKVEETTRRITIT